MKIILEYAFCSAIITCILYPLVRLSMRPAAKLTPKQKKAWKEMYEEAESMSEGQGGAEL